MLRLDEGAADQSKLDAASRRSNLAGAVTVTGLPFGNCVVVDDVVTTGATLQSSVEKLMAAGATVTACLALCAA